MVLSHHDFFITIIEAAALLSHCLVHICAAHGSCMGYLTRGSAHAFTSAAHEHCISHLSSRVNYGGICPISQAIVSPVSHAFDIGCPGSCAMLLHQLLSLRQ